MINLIKYEFIRKSRLLTIFFTIAIVLNVVVLIQLLPGSHTVEEQMIALAAFFGGMLTVFFVLFIVDVIMMYAQDINSKSGYMLFLTPNSGFTLLGSKVLTGILEGLLFIAFFLLLLVINFWGFFREPLQEILSSGFMETLLTHIHLEGFNLFPFFIVNLLMMFVGIVTLILMIFAAISIRKSILAEKKFGGLLSFVIFMLLGWLVAKISELIYSMAFQIGILTEGAPSYGNITLEIVIQAILGILLFLLSAYLLDKKMDL